MNSSTKPLLVVGAGIAGVTAAIEAAEAGAQVVLVESDPSIGGRVLRNYNYFPKLCPPSCGMEINTRRVERNPRIRVLTNTRVTQAGAADGGWSVTVTRAPEYVNQSCTACDDCSAVCPAKVKDSFNLEMCEAPAIRIPHSDAWPHVCTLDRSACPDGCKKCVEACKYNAINLDAKETQETIEASSVILATGWHPYPLENLTELGGGQLKNVIANVNLERMVADVGPTAGKILRPSDGEPPKKVAFVQCAGSRDVKHLPYCSGVCCLASLKQALYVNEQLPEAEVTIYYIDRRAPGRNEDMLTRVAAMDGVKMVKGKVGKIEEGAGGMLSLRLEDVEAGQLLEAEADLVVLATGMVSNLRDANLPFNAKMDEDGFGLDDAASSVFVAGVTRRPEDVASSTRDATGAAAKAIIAAGRRA
ncbi:MAG: CoB--CoM heterodisulfide reductase iron-sulfur subunit A family protein [Deltaproteobacteria bacterium]|nr:CoB--CoM heterodisulfide reductase iron-sulfur subunit A family protein [Deltaproteobacteria bacterium]